MRAVARESRRRWGNFAMARLQRSEDHTISRRLASTADWALRHTLSGYNVTYVALAEKTADTALLTTDARLARAPGIECRIQLL